MPLTTTAAPSAGLWTNDDCAPLQPPRHLRPGRRRCLAPSADRPPAAVAADVLGSDRRGLAMRRRRSRVHSGVAADGRIRLDCRRHRAVLHRRLARSSASALPAPRPFAGHRARPGIAAGRALVQALPVLATATVLSPVPLVARVLDSARARIHHSSLRSAKRRSIAARTAGSSGTRIPSSSRNTAITASASGSSWRSLGSPLR